MEGNIKNHILPRLGSKKVATLDFADVDRLHRDMRDLPGAANRVIALLSKMLNLAERWRMRPQGTNPTKFVERYRENKMHRDLTDLELRRLAKVLGDDSPELAENPRALAAIRLLLFTGCRRNEVLHLRWSEVDLERAVIRLEDSKTGAKVIRLNSAAVEVLRAQEQAPKILGNPYVFPGLKPLKPLHDINGVWERIRKRAGIEDVRLHDLRHTFATYAVGAGHGLPVVGKLLGHKTPATTARYADLADDPARRAAEDVGAAISRAMASSGSK